MDLLPLISIRKQRIKQVKIFDSPEDTRYLAGPIDIRQLPDPINHSGISRQGNNTSYKTQRESSIVGFYPPIINVKPSRDPRDIRIGGNPAKSGARFSS